MIITPTSLTITQLLGSSNEQYVIPAYQRRYSWKDKQLVELLDDIALIDGSDTHLLGTIVCLTGRHVAGMNRLELVDGQQRLTTVSILLQCIRERLLESNETAEAQDIDRLLEAKALGEKPVSKIALDSIDSTEFKRLAHGEVIETPENLNLNQAFVLFRQWVREQPLSKLGTFLYRLKNQAIIIRLDVSDAKDAFKLFETINNRGLRLSPTDIIKNFLLGNAARFSSESLELARAKWADLIAQLDGVNFETFFRQFICARLRRRITTSYVIANFKKIFMQQVNEAASLPERHWYADEESEDDELEDDNVDSVTLDVESDEDEPMNISRVSFASFMEDLIKCATVYGRIVRGETGNVQVDRHLRNLRMIKSVQTYGFLMYLRVNGCSDADFLRILKMTESLLVRRHICKMRSNETETAFAKLCGVDCRQPISAVVDVYREYSPSDEKFRDAFTTFTFGPGLVERARYCLEQYERHHQGIHEEIFVGGPDLVHVEHIIPQKIKTKRAKVEFGDWPEYLGSNADSRHSRYVSRIGNMTLFAGKLNIVASNNPYDRKKGAYKDSALRITNTLPQEYPEFRFDEVEDRSLRFAEWAISRWPVPEVQGES